MSSEPSEPSVTRRLSQTLANAMSSDPSEPSVTRRLSQTLANTLVDVPPDEAGASGEREPLIRRSTQAEPTADTNRESYEENQRRLVSQMLAQQFVRAGLLLLLMCLLILVLIGCTVAVYAKGYLVYIRERGKPCDQPLKEWLLVLLAAFPVRACLVLLYLRRRRRPDDEGGYWISTSTISFLLRLWQLALEPVLYILGLWWLLHCKTCQTSSPDLYSFVKVFFLLQLFLWAGSISVLFGITSLVLWLHRHGFFEEGPGRHMAATPGLIDKIETVPYSTELFSERPGMGKQPPECCVCQVRFDGELPIKRTPCDHYFHRDCLGTWLEKYAKSCPLCRLNLESAFAEGEGSAGGAAVCAAV